MGARSKQEIEAEFSAKLAAMQAEKQEALQKAQNTVVASPSLANLKANTIFRVETDYTAGVLELGDPPAGLELQPTGCVDNQRGLVHVFFVKQVASK